ncbi:selenocysteine insertion sequence-binding protein 2-like [Ixodes scapularis]
MSETVKSTLSADASPFVPRNFGGGSVEAPPAAVGDGELAYVPPTETLQTLYVAQIPSGYYASYVPTLPFYTVPYPCIYQAPAPVEASLPDQTHSKSTQGVRKSKKKPKTNRRREQQSPRDIGVLSADPSVLSDGQGTKVIGKAINSDVSTASPDLANNAEFPSLSMEDRPAPVGERLGVSYSTALQHSSSKKLLASTAPSAVPEEHVGRPPESQRRKGAARRGARTAAAVAESADHNALPTGAFSGEADTTAQLRRGNSSSARRLRRKPHDGSADKRQLPPSSPGPETAEQRADEKVAAEEAPQRKNAGVGRGVRMSTGRKEGHHSTLARNVIKAEQRGRRRTDGQPWARQEAGAEDGTDAKSVGRSDADVGMQEPPDSCREVSDSKGAREPSDGSRESSGSKKPQDRPSQCFESESADSVNNLMDYPPLGSSVPLRRSGEPKKPEPVDTTSKLPPKGKGKPGAPLKPLASTNSARPKHKAAISMAIADIMVPKQRQPKKLKENLVERTSKKAEAQRAPANTLDSSAPVRKRGKEREMPARKKLTVMKKIILKEREERKQLLARVKQATLARQSLIENASETCCLEDGLPQQETKQLHSTRFREYCDQMLSVEINQATKALITDLVFFQDRLHQKDPIKAKSKRRLVCGLKEVKKYLLLKKLKCVVFAPDIEEVKAEGGLDASLQALLQFARSQFVPTVFALRRRTLGSLARKKVPISCIGIFDYSGREEQYKHLLELVAAAREEYSVLRAAATVNGTRDSPQGAAKSTRSVHASSLGVSNDDEWTTANEESDNEQEHSVAAITDRVAEILVNSMRAVN